MADASFGSPGRVPVVTLVRSDGLRLPVHRDLVGLTTLLLDLTEALGYDVIPGQTWGYAPRYISGTTTWSNHAWATADDVNAPANPYASADWHSRNARGTFPFGLRLVCDIPQKVIELWEAHGYRWGGRYRTKPDPMHLEFMGTVTEAHAIEKRLRDFLAGEGSPPPPAPSPPPPTTLEYQMDTLDLRNVTADPSTWVKGRHVDNLQALMVSVLVYGKRGDLVGALVTPYGTQDGIGGPGTRKALKACQDILRYIKVLDSPTSDEVVGAKTWKALIEF